MITTQVRSLWKGLLPVRDVFVKRALDSGGKLCVSLKDKTYVLTEEKLKRPVMKLSVPDHFSKDIHQLLYFAPPKEVPPQTALF